VTMPGRSSSQRSRALDKFCPVPQRFEAVYGRVLFVTLLFFFTFISRFIFSPLMPSIGKDVGLSPGQAGSLFFFASVGALGGSLLSGFLSARINHRGTLIFASLVTGATLMTCYFAHSVLFVQIAMIVLGVCAGLNQPSVVATVAAMVRREDWGKALSIQQLGPRLSYAAAPFLAVALLAAFSWQPHWRYWESSRLRPASPSSSGRTAEAFPVLLPTSGSSGDHASAILLDHGPTLCLGHWCAGRSLHHDPPLPDGGARVLRFLCQHAPRSGDDPSALHHLLCRLAHR